MKKWTLLFLLLVAPLIARDIIADKEKITLDETLTLTLTTPIPEGYHVDKPPLRINLLAAPTQDRPPFTLVSEKDLSFTLEPWVTGEHTLSFGTVTFLPDDPSKAEPIRTLTDTITITVNPAKAPSAFIPHLLPPPGTPHIQITPETQRRLEETQEYGQAATIRNERLFDERSFPWRIVVFSAAILAILWFGRKWLWEKLHHKLPFIPDPHEQALKALEELEKEDLPRQGQYQRFYVTLTYIVRVFIEKAYDLQAPELTTEEFLSVMSKSDAFDRETKERLDQFLNYADLVKFAKEQPSNDDCFKALSNAKTFVAAYDRANHGVFSKPEEKF